MSLQSIDPRTGSLVREYPEATDTEVHAALAAGVAAFESWRRTSFDDTRLRCCGAPRRSCATGATRSARLMAVEMGKPVTQGRAEVEKCACVCDYYAEHAASLLAPETARHRRLAELRRLRAARRRAGGHAVELPVLAGVPLRGAGADGRQRRAAEARLERHRLRAGDRGASCDARACPGRCSARSLVPSAARGGPDRGAARSRR